MAKLKMKVVKVAPNAAHFVRAYLDQEILRAKQHNAGKKPRNFPRRERLIAAIKAELPTWDANSVNQVKQVYPQGNYSDGHIRRVAAQLKRSAK